VDLDEEPLQLAKENAHLNQVRIHFAQADAFLYMREMLQQGRQYDVVVLDPPKLIRNRDEIDEGTRKHFDLNRLAMRLVRPGGLMLSCSCSGLLTEDEFLRLLRAASLQSGPLLADATADRGARHAARQLQIIQALGWPEPVYAHLPLIHGPDGAKLSKRHGALAVEAYRDMGYLPETMRNYLLRLGWSHGNDEIIPTAQAIEWFNLENIGKSPARLDFKKLDNLNAHYIRATDEKALADEIAALLGRGNPPRALNEKARARLIAAMPSLKERAKTLVELADAAEFLYTDGARTLDEAAQKVVTAEARRLNSEFLALTAQTPWEAAALEEKVRSYADAKGLKLGQVAQPLRAALTGRTTSPPIFAMLEVLGRDESVVRIKAYSA